MPLNILIVDDSAVMRGMILKSLHMSGVPLGEVHQAANGQEGIDCMNDNWIDLIFADLNMPVMDGEEMINRMRETPDKEDIPIIVISTEGSETRIDRLKQKGISFIHKPFTPEIIRDTINDLTGISPDGPS